MNGKLVERQGYGAAESAGAALGKPERRRLRVAFATLGCKVNQYDTATMETALLGGNCEVVAFSELADVYVVNTCTVTDRADAESRSLARRAKRLNENARVVMTGCMAQTSSEATAALPEVDYVVGIGRLGDFLRAVRGEIAQQEGRIFTSNVRKSATVETLGAEVFSGQTRAFLKVQEGCDLFCTFCIVPFARGRSRSVEPRRVLAELQRLAQRGFHEVVLTGVHLGGYGRDLTPGLDLADLVEMIAAMSPVARVRLSSIDPPEVSTRLLEIMRASDVICPHLHVPVQSGADPVLRRMRRQYDAAMVRDVAAEVRRMMPEASLGTDVIAGFPGETEADFETARALLDAAPFTYFHVFPYSRRSGTTAAKAKAPVSSPTIRARAAALRRLGETKRVEFAQQFVGSNLRVLAESKRDRETGLLVGYSRNYVRALVRGGDELINRESVVRVVARQRDRVLAEPLSASHRDATIDA